MNLREALYTRSAALTRRSKIVDRAGRSGCDFLASLSRCKCLTVPGASQMVEGVGIVFERRVHEIELRVLAEVIVQADGVLAGAVVTNGER